MSFKSKLARLPKHQRFHYEPRYSKKEEEKKPDRRFDFRSARRQRNQVHSLVGKLRNERIGEKHLIERDDRLGRMVLLLLMMATLIFFFVGEMTVTRGIGFVAAFGLILFVFIRRLSTHR